MLRKKEKGKRKRKKEKGKTEDRRNGIMEKWNFGKMENGKTEVGRGETEDTCLPVGRDARILDARMLEFVFWNLGFVLWNLFFGRPKTGEME